MGELFGAERRLRGREQQQGRGLTHSQLRALIVLGKTDEVTAGDLAKSADLNPASVTAMLDHLESSGIVERRRSAWIAGCAWSRSPPRAGKSSTTALPDGTRCGKQTSGNS